MNISLKWLKKYISIDLTIDQISEILTAIGLEVEGVEEIETIKGGLNGIIVGKVITCDKHPNADSLSITTVDIGNEELLSIVCGAPNVATGQKVLVATIGTVLYDKEGAPWKIKKGKIRGEVSQGMICAEDELGLGDSHEGIMVLENDVEIGLEAAIHFEVDSDFIFDIGLTPNRSDATSHYGVAKDLMAYMEVNHPGEASFKNISLSEFVVDNQNDHVDIEIIDKNLCPRFSGIVLSNVTVQESPKWIKDFLNVIGVKPINNIVDITNYVLHEYGQPLHAYDASKITGNKIIVSTLQEATPFVGLDDIERKLSAEDIIICDGELNPMCIAGVFGGVTSGVTNETKKIFLESAYFDPKYIRRTSTRHLLRTDAAQRFEKGADPNITVDALKRAGVLIKLYGGATISSDIIDVYPDKIDKKEIVLRYSILNEKIGDVLSKEEVNKILQALEMEIEPIDDNSIKVKVPTNKADVLREVDLIEEVLRIYGYNKVKIGNDFQNIISYTVQPNKLALRNLLSDMLVSKGFHEMMNLSLIESKYYTDILTIPNNELVYINNTSNIHLDIMRPEMLLSGLLTILRNQNRQQKNLHFFELGKSYKRDGDSIKETEVMSLFITGSENEESWLLPNDKLVNIYSLKKTVNEILDRIGLNNLQFEEIQSSDKLNYGVKRYRGNQSFLNYGLVKNEILTKIGVKNPVYYAEIDMDKIFGALKKPKLYVEQLSKFPAVRRDLACVLDQNISFDKIEIIAKKNGKKLLKEVSLFDVYINDKQLGQGKKSYAVKYVFQDEFKTLKDKDVDKIMNNIVRNLEKDLGAHIRK